MAMQPASRGGSTARSRSAFTLIEVLVALGIVVALIAVAVPVLLLSFDARRIEAEAESVGVAFGSLRAEAVRHRASLALYFVEPAGEWGGELILGPLSLEGGLGSGERDSAPRGAEAGQVFEERIIHRARQPYRLSLEPFSAWPTEAFGDDGRGHSGVGSGGAREPVRIAAVSASGEVLASRKLWCADEKQMFSVEVGLGLGTPLVSTIRMIPNATALGDDDAEEQVEGPGDEQEDGVPPEEVP